MNRTKSSTNRLLCDFEAVLNAIAGFSPSEEGDDSVDWLEQLEE
jgi:hypothetical protein